MRAYLTFITLVGLFVIAGFWLAEARAAKAGASDVAPARPLGG